MRGERLLIVNPAASGVDDALLRAVERELAAGGPVATVHTERPGHACELAASVAPGTAAVYVLGGDGAYNEVVNGLVADVPVGFLPGGATSVLPRALGLPRDPVRCARRLAAAQASRRIALGRANGRRFTFSCGVGLDAELVRAVDGHGRTSGRRAGDHVFAWELLRLLAARRGRIDERLTIEGYGRVAFVAIANCCPYTYAGRLPVRLAPLADFGCGLDVVAPRAVRPHDLPGLAWHALVRPGGESDRLVHLHDVDALRIRCDVPTAVQLDGEDLGDVEAVDVICERDALSVLV